MTIKIKCLFHQEDTASLVLYPYTNSFRCFGCGVNGPLKDLPESALTELTIEDFLPKPKEDVSSTLAYIAHLPLVESRGLIVPSDGRSFYLVWPDKSYYLRRFTDGSEPKYKGPLGHDRPLYRASTSRSSTLILTEGELNAASIGVAYGGNVVSIGGTGNFTQNRLNKYLHEFNRYETIVVLLDDDPAGSLAAIEVCGFLKAHGKEVRLCMLKKDANWVLVYEGRERLKSLVEGCLNRGLETSTEEW